MKFGKEGGDMIADNKDKTDIKTIHEVKEASDYEWEGIVASSVDYGLCIGNITGSKEAIEKLIEKINDEVKITVKEV